LRKHPLFLEEVGAFCDIHRQKREKQQQSRHKATDTTAEITNFAQTLIHNNTMDFTFKSFIQVLSCGFALLASAFRAEPPKGSQPIDEMRKNMVRKMTLTDKQRLQEDWKAVKGDQMRAWTKIKQVSGYICNEITTKQAP
jgi:hypothetical protein